MTFLDQQTTFKLRGQNKLRVSNGAPLTTELEVFFIRRAPAHDRDLFREVFGDLTSAVEKRKLELAQPF